MKHILILSLFCSSLAYGQTDTAVRGFMTKSDYDRFMTTTVYSVPALKPDTFEVCRIISNVTPSNWWRKVDHRPYPAILYAVANPSGNVWMISYLDHKKRPLKPWIRVWEN